jgi:DNA-binding transcriptional LysR family regulator
MKPVITDEQNTMNLRQVEMFKALMETGSITGASQRLRISQPSASKHLQGLEQSIGVTLFVRTGNRLVATSEAQAFYAQVERSFYGLEHLARFADGLKHHPSGQIVVAAPPMLARQWLPEIMAPFLKEHVDVSIALPIRSSRWVAEAIANGQADLGLGLAVVDFGYVEQESLMRVPLVCAMQNAHPLTSLTEVRPSDLADQTLITLSNFDHWRLAVETALDQEQARPRQRVDTFSTQVACELAARGTGVAIVDALTALDYAQRGLVWRRFVPATSFEIMLMRSRHRPVSRLAETLTAMMYEAAETTSQDLAKAGVA